MIILAATSGDDEAEDGGGGRCCRFVLSLAEDRLLDGRMYEAFEKGFEHQVREAACNG